MTKRCWVLGLITSMLFVSCSKNDVTANREDVIGAWQVTEIRSDRPYDWDGDGFTETDILGTYSFCQRDIILVFEEGGYGQSRQGCNAFWENMYWELNGRFLDIDLPGDQLQLDLIQFTPSTIRGQDNVYVNGENFTVTYSLSRR